MHTKSVQRAFRAVLRRHPSDEERRVYESVDHEESWLVDELSRSYEHTAIVAPVREATIREWDLWQMLHPSDADLDRTVAETRGALGDDGVQQAHSAGTLDRHISLRPFNLMMDITNQCNLRCVMCNFSQPEFYKAKRKHMSLEAFQRLGEQTFHRVAKLSLSCGTEPLLHKDIIDFLRVLQRYEVPHTYMNTNAQLLREPVMQAMVAHELHRIYVSVDAATAETYPTIRVGAKWDRLMTNLRTLQKIKAANGSRYPEIGMMFVMMKHNIHELPAFVDLAADLGAFAVNAMHMIAWQNVGNEPLGAVHDKQRCNRFLTEAAERARIRGIDFAAPPLFQTTAPNTGQSSPVTTPSTSSTKNPTVPSVDPQPTASASPEITSAPASEPSKVNPETLVVDPTKRAQSLGIEKRFQQEPACPFPWNFVAIGMHGDVTPCGWWQGTPAMGNVWEQDFLTIWQSDRYRQLRERLLNQQLEGPCSRCSAAGMGNPDADTAFAPR